MANKVYRAIETAIRFKDSDATYTLTLNNLAATTGGRISDRVDRGAGSLPRRYRWKAVMQFETAPVVGEHVAIYIAQSDGTNADGNVGSSDAALTAAVAANLDCIGIVRVQTTDADSSMIASGVCTIDERYYSVGVLNKTADNLRAENDYSWVELTPIPDELQ
ncbi:MAG: hypothetical protein ACOY3P_03495 [Planctomycetota bacterium]